MKTFKKLLTYLLVLVVAVAMAGAGIWWLVSSRQRGQEIGSVNTAFHLLGSDGISVEAFDDQAIDGVTCYLSRARVGGLKGNLGLAADKTEASIACRQTKEQVTVKGALPANEEIFNEKMSAVFKTLHVVRMVDTQRNVLLYLTYSDKLLDGSPKNSLTAVPVSKATPLMVK